jgi:hypothetical protein
MNNHLEDWRCGGWEGEKFFQSSNLPSLPSFQEDNNENLANLYFNNPIHFDRLRFAEQRQPYAHDCAAGPVNFNGDSYRAGGRGCAYRQHHSNGGSGC